MVCGVLGCQYVLKKELRESVTEQIVKGRLKKVKDSLTKPLL